MELFASVLRLDRGASKALKITDTYSLHRVIYSLFDDIRNTEEKNNSVCSGIQWVDKGGDAHCRQMLILSNRKPKKNIDGKHGEVAIKLLPQDFLKHRHYRFEVCMNPVKRDKASKKILAIKGREAIEDWFTKRAETNWGFTITPSTLQVDGIRVLKFEAKHPITLQQAKLTGYLNVNDPQRFAESVAKGIGKGRSFGCGLLQIVPVGDTSLI